MAFSVISISSDSIEESVGTSTARVILFGMILTTVPATAPIVALPVIHDDTSRIPTDTPTISPIVPAIPPIAPTNSSSQTSSDSHSDTSSYSSLRNSSSGHPLSDSPCDSPTATSVRPSCKRCRSHTSSVHIASFIPRALSLVRVDLLPPRKRIRYFDSETDFEVSLEEGYVPYVPREIENIDACIAFANEIAARWIDVRVEVRTTAKEEAESSTRGTIEIRVDRVTHPVVLDDTAEPVGEDSPELVSADRSLEVMQRGLDVVMQELYDHMVEIPVHRVKVIESVQRDQGHRIVATSQQSATMSERIGTLEWDNTAYNQRFQELTLLCTRVVFKEEDQVEKYIGGLLDNIQGNVIVVEPVRLQDAIRIANNFIDQKLKCYTIKNDENKRRFDNSSRDNRRQQQPYKRQNINGQNVARAYTVRNNVEMKGNKTGNKTGNNKAKARAYEIRGGGANPDSNVITGTFLLNNRYASKLFDSGVGKSFVSTTLSALIDVILSTLDTSYAIELANGRISKTDVILRGCTLGLLGHPFDIDLISVELGSFNVIIGMYWLAKYHAVIVCDKKIVRIPYGDKVWIIEGDGCNGGMTYFKVSSVEVYELYVPRETGLRVDVEDSYEPYTEPNIDPDVQADINECFAYADAIRARGMDVRVMVETMVEDEVDSSARADGAVEVT
nr:reverse transcriptase domain-containing protein [Tanacetum cinerariifolium]